MIRAGGAKTIIKTIFQSIYKAGISRMRRTAALLSPSWDPSFWRPRGHRSIARPRSTTTIEKREPQLEDCSSLPLHKWHGTSIFIRVLFYLAEEGAGRSPSLASIFPSRLLSGLSFCSVCIKWLVHLNRRVASPELKSGWWSLANLKEYQMWNKTGSEEELSSLFRTIETRNQSPTMMMGEEKYNSGFYRYDLFLSSSCPHYFTLSNHDCRLC